MCSRVVVIQEGKLVTERSIGSSITGEELTTLTIRVHDTELAERAISKFEDVQLLNHRHTDGSIVLQLTEERIPELIESLCESKVKVYRVEENKSSLEEEFLKWTGGNRIA
ncbi:ABC transporter, ATP-binding protein [Paenibacillus sp. JCM 10914]|nr:ABC transporter, ATP-binding protein [Paenibacillus sp. JCM 10914]